MEGLLEIKNLNIQYSGQNTLAQAVRNFTLTFRENTSYGIVGESGSGKSTLALGILRLLNEKNTRISGEILYGGKDILQMSEEEFQPYRWRHFATVFQSSMNALSPLHKIKEQFRDIYRAHIPNISKKEIDNGIREALTKVQLEESVAGMYPHELSGGMIQRVCIALSLLLHPKILIMDEATTALDLITENGILETIRKTEKKEPLMRIMITHDISIVAHNCEKTVVMYGGCLLEEGDTKALLSTFPSVETSGKLLTSIEGALPDLTKTHTGCIYYERCKYKTAKCLERQPELYKTDSGQVACYRWEAEHGE